MAGWFFRVLLVALLASAVEMALLVPVFPAAGSSVAGLLSAFVLITRVFALVGVVAAGLGFALERTLARLPLPDPARLVAVVGGTAITVGALHAAVLALLRIEIDFTATRNGLLLIATLIAVVAGHVVTDVVLAPAARVVLSHAPTLGTPRAVTAFVLVLMATVGMALGHVVLAPVHLVGLAGVAGGASVVLALAASRLAIPAVPRPLGIVSGVLLVVLVGSLPLDRSRAGRFILFGPASTAGPIATVLRDLADRDADGTAPRWAGGTDCSEGDPSRGPLVRDIPGDGVDQDCRGGDAPAAPANSNAGGGASHVAWAGCRPFARPPPVLLITIDAMRADALNSRVSPRLMDLARASVVFERAYSPSTMTGGSLAAVFTGRPLTDLNARNVLMDDALVVGERLVDRFRKAGYRTARFNTFDLSEAIIGGFEEHDLGAVDVQPRAKGQLLAAAMTGRVEAYLERSDPRPAFVWVHYPDTHAPYPFAEARAPAPRDPTLTPYERGVEYVDHHVGRLLDALARDGKLRETIVAVAADHGEDLGLRLREGHGGYLFDDATRVPLIIWDAGCAPRVISEPVSTLGLGATLGALAGVPVPGPDLLRGGAAPTLPVVVEEASVDTLGFKRAVILGPYKLIVDERNGGRMLFDLANDASEAKDVYDTESTARQGVEAAYQRWLDQRGAHVLDAPGAPGAP